MLQHRFNPALHSETHLPKCYILSIDLDSFRKASFSCSGASKYHITDFPERIFPPASVSPHDSTTYHTSPIYLEAAHRRTHLTRCSALPKGYPSNMCKRSKRHRANQSRSKGPNSHEIDEMGGYGGAYPRYDLMQALETTIRHFLGLRIVDTGRLMLAPSL